MTFLNSPAWWLFAVFPAMLFILVAAFSTATYWAWYGVALLVLSAVAITLTRKYVVWYRPEEGNIR